MDKKKIPFLARFRGWIQAAAALLTNIHLPNFVQGKLYQGSGKTVCVPLCGKGGSMTARKITALSELQTGHYGILEPSDTEPEIAPENIDLILAPALSCDRKGYRLGYGGYYDRFLSRTNAVCAALCASQRMSAALPHEAFDRCCHYIITEREVLRTDESR